MNNSIRAAGVLAVALCAVTAQAYNYNVKNFTGGDHEVFVRFQGFFGAGEGEESLGMVKANGGTVSKYFGGGRIWQCIKTDIRIDQTVTPIVQVNQPDLDAVLRMKDNPFGLRDFINYKESKRTVPTGLYCFDRDLYIFQGPNNTFIVVTPS